MARSWLITCRGIAKKIRYATPAANRQVSELIAEARRECPNCSYVIDNSDVAMHWPGLPVGVKFDPSELELLEHLEQKIGLGGSRSHVLIDEFIPTIDNDEGICYSHPENLPGIKTDGSNAHFFHRVSNAYGSGHRKRRRVINCSDNTIPDRRVRWHKTGRSKAIYNNGVIKGWKKILVLYKTSQRGGKPDRANWVMHQYHLGEEEDEMDGELVVSKIFCPLPNKTMEISETETSCEEPDAPASVIGPKTPKTITPQPRHPKNSPCETEENIPILQDQLLLDGEGDPTMPIISLADDAMNPAWCALAEEHQLVGEASRAQSNSYEPLLCREDPNSLNDKALLSGEYLILSQCRSEILDWNLNGYGLPDLNSVDDAMNPAWCAVAEEQQLVGEASGAQSNSYEPLLCREDPNSLNDKALLPGDYPILSQCRNEILDWNLNEYGLPDLNNVDLGTPPDLQLADLQFGSQDLQFGSQESLGSWLDRL